MGLLRKACHLASVRYGPSVDGSSAIFKIRVSVAGDLIIHKRLKNATQVLRIADHFLLWQLTQANAGSNAALAKK